MTDLDRAPPFQTLGVGSLPRDQCVSDGEWRRINYLDVIVEAVYGLQRGLIPTREFSTSTVPAVVSRLKQRSPLVAHSAEFLVKHAEQKTIVSVPSPHTIGKNFWSADHSPEVYDTPEEYVQDVIPIIRAEIRRLVDLGVDAIQIDEVWLASLANPAFRTAEGILDLDREMESNVAAINAVVKGHGRSANQRPCLWLLTNDTRIRFSELEPAFRRPGTHERRTVHPGIGRPQP